MKYLKTKHEQNSAKITTLITLVLVLLLFVVGTNYMDPPEEYGVAINFGNSSVGAGEVQPVKPIQTKKNSKTVEELKEVESTNDKIAPSKSISKAEDVMTAETAEAVAVKKAKADAKLKADADFKELMRKEAEEKALEAKKAHEKQLKKEKLDALIGGVKNAEGAPKQGEGPGDGIGDKGDLNGNPYAPYKGIPGSGTGGVGYGLNGRGKPSFKLFEGCENEYAVIVVDIVVNPNGKVIEATAGVKGSDYATACLKSQAKKIAMSYKWPANSNAPSRQFGKVVINFSPTH